MTTIQDRIIKDLENISAEKNTPIYNWQEQFLRDSIKLIQEETRKKLEFDMQTKEDVFKLPTEEIRIIRFPNGQSMIKTQISDARKVMSILAITLGGFVKEIQSQNIGREMEILNHVLDTIKDVSNDKNTTIKPITNSEIQ